jgi:hypothetical protein
LDPEGRLAVFWHRFFPTAGNPKKSRLLGQLIDADGERAGSEVLVTTQAGRPIGCESVATNGESWMLAWQGWGAQGYGIYVQRFGSQP